MRITDIITEGYTIMPSIDPKYTVMPDMEGPFQLRNGKVVYYDPKQGQYYDRDTDQYISYEDYREMDAPTAQSNKMNQLQGRIDLIKRMIKRTNNAAKKQQLTVELNTLINSTAVGEAVSKSYADASKKREIQRQRLIKKAANDVSQLMPLSRDDLIKIIDRLVQKYELFDEDSDTILKMVSAKSSDVNADGDVLDERAHSVKKAVSTPQGHKSWAVWIRNNYYTGKYADYSARPYIVIAGSADEAKKVVLDNAEYVLKDLMSKRMHNGKRVLPPKSALPITDKEIGRIEDGTVKIKLNTVNPKTILSPQGPINVTLRNGEIVDVQQPIGERSLTTDQRPYSVVKTTDKPQIVKPTTGGESPHPYQGKLVGEDSTARNRNRKMAQATDYEQRAKETRSPIKAAHFRKMADDIRSSILADQSEQSVKIKPSPFAKVNESSPEARKAAIRAVQNSYQQIARDLIAGYGDDLDAMSALDSVMGNLEMAGDRETVAYIRGLGADLRATFAKEALGKWEGINTFAKVGATESLQKAVKNREASRKRAIARAAADLRASGGKKSVAELIKFYELFPNDAEKILQLASAQKESVQVNSTQYQFAHGKPPKGYGSWFFTRNRRGVDFRKDELNTDYIQVSMMNYADAKRAAQQWAKEKGYGMIYVAENAQHIDEVAHELGLQDHEPRVVKGVRGLKSLNFTKKFPNHAAQERWMDQNPSYEVRQVQRESATSSKDKNQSETQVASWGSSKVIHAAAGDQAHSMMLSLQNQNDLAKLSDGDYTKITDELGVPLTVSRKNQQFTLSTADGKLSVTVDAADIISLYAR